MAPVKGALRWFLADASLAALLSGCGGDGGCELPGKHDQVGLSEIISLPVLVKEHSGHPYVDGFVINGGWFEMPRAASAPLNEPGLRAFPSVTPGPHTAFLTNSDGVLTLKIERESFQLVGPLACL